MTEIQVEEKSELELAIGVLEDFVDEARLHEVEPREVTAAIGSVLFAFENLDEELGDALSELEELRGASTERLQALATERESARILAAKYNVLFRGLQNMGRDLDLTQAELDRLG